MATQILRAGNFLPGQRDTPRQRGPGKGDYEHEVLIWNRPRRRFGYFAAVGKVTRRPQAAKFPLPITNQIQNLPPHPPQCAHWGTFPQGEGLYKKQETPGSAKTAGTGGTFID